MQNPKSQLATVAAAFEQWRLNRSSSAQKTPPELQQQAVALLEHLSTSKIMAALKISGGNLKRWAAQIKNTHPVTEFVALPLNEQPPLEQLNLEVALANGCQLRLCGNISPEHLSAVTQNISMIKAGPTK